MPHRKLTAFDAEIVRFYKDTFAILEDFDDLAEQTIVENKKNGFIANLRQFMHVVKQWAMQHVS